MNIVVGWIQDDDNCLINICLLLILFFFLNNPD